MEPDIYTDLSGLQTPGVRIEPPMEPLRQRNSVYGIVYDIHVCDVLGVELTVVSQEVEGDSRCATPKLPITAMK